MPDYSQVVKDHFFHPRNCGSLDDPSGIGTEGTPGGGRFMEIWVKIESGRIGDIAFKGKQSVVRVLRRRERGIWAQIKERRRSLIER